MAGEVKPPNSFSLRCVDILRKMSGNEAKIFESLRPYIIDYRGTWAIINDEELNKKYEVKFEKIFSMAECGVIDSLATMQLTINVQNEYPLEIVHSGKLLRASNVEDRKIVLPMYVLTQTGTELLSIIGGKMMEIIFMILHIG